VSPILIRYLLHGRAPQKERACLLLLRVLPSIRLDEPPFGHATFLALEQHVVWHEALLKQSSHLVPLEGTALLPTSSQCLLDLLIEARERLTTAGLTPWPSSLSWMSDVCELSALSKWLLEPTRNACPRTSVRLASRAAQVNEVDPRAFHRWPAQQDAALINLVHSSLHVNALSLRSSQLASLADQAREASTALHASFSTREVSLRLALLQRFNQLLARHLPLVHTGMARKSGTLGERLCRLRGAVLLETKLVALEQACATTLTDCDPIACPLNRFKAAKLRGRAEAEHSGAGTLFVQLVDQLGHVKPRALLRHDKAFKANFSGEAADDHGGPYREAIAAICAELQSEALPLFLRSPNGVNGVGECRDAFVPNPSATSPLEMEWYYFVGRLLALSLRQRETQLGLSLPSVVWKQLVAEPLDSSDLAAFDAMCKQSLDKLRRIADEGVDAEMFADVIFETFTTQLSDGTEVSVLPGGASIAVTFDNRGEFCDGVLQARLCEAQPQCDAVFQGLSYLVPQRLLTLFTWQQLQLLACGASDIDLDLLRQKTKYGVGVSPGQRHVRYMWLALRRFTPEQRALFLRFVWGRTRLPATPADWGDARFTLHTRHTSSPDTALPIAHTCFFSLELPAYSTAAICQERILYAITNCQDIDMDTTTSARENRERAVANDDSDDDDDGQSGFDANYMRT
jgi:hypothetical protein